MPAEAVVATLQQAWQVLGELHIPSALMGGLALTHWGHIRATQDVDLLIALSGVRPTELLAKLAAVGFRAKRRDPLVRLDDAEFIQLFYVPGGEVIEVQIDLLLAEAPFHRQAVERRITLPDSVLGFQVDVVSCEDLIILKLLAGRVLDRVDAGELLKANRATIDFDYLQGWVRALKLQRAFGEVWHDVFPEEKAPR